MIFEGITLSELSQTEKDEDCMFSHMWNLKKIKLIKSEHKWWLPGPRKLGKWGGNGQRHKLSVVR